MIRNKFIDCEEPLREHLRGFRRAAGVPDTTPDGDLVDVLRAAFIRVQEQADKSLLPSEYELTVDEMEKGYAIVRLYQDPSEVLSVTDGNGRALAYHWAYNVVTLEEYAPMVVIRYKTRPTPGNIKSLIYSVYQTATAEYDGDKKEENGVISSLC